MGDAAAAAEERFLQIYRDAGDSAYRYVLRRLRSVQDSQDVTAEVFATVWRRIEAVPPSPEDRLWVIGVARRIVARHERGAQRRLRLQVRLTAVVPSIEPDRTEAALPLAPALEKALRSLRPLDREALLLVVWDGLSHTEVAQVLGCSANAVAIRLHRARARLRVELGQRSAVDPDTGNPPSAVMAPRLP